LKELGNSYTFVGRFVDPRRGTGLSVTGTHAATVPSLANIDRDLFDWLLIAQSIVESLTLLTYDALLARYRDGVRVV